MKHLSFYTIAVAVLGISFSTTANASTQYEYEQYVRSARYFSTLSNAEKKEAEKEYNVDTVYQIPTRNKPLLTEYYVNKSSEYGAYTVDREFIYNPYRLLSGYRVNDKRRYPATVLPTIRAQGTYYPRGYQPVSEPKYTYFNAPVRHHVTKPGEITFYNNFTAYPTSNTRW